MVDNEKAGAAPRLRQQADAMRLEDMIAKLWRRDILRLRPRLRQVQAEDVPDMSFHCGWPAALGDRASIRRRDIGDAGGLIDRHILGAWHSVYRLAGHGPGLLLDPRVPRRQQAAAGDSDRAEQRGRYASRTTWHPTPRRW